MINKLLCENNSGTFIILNLDKISHVEIHNAKSQDESMLCCHVFFGDQNVYLGNSSTKLLLEKMGIYICKERQ